MKTRFNTALYWLCYAAYLYIIAPSCTAKIFMKPAMMQSMLSLGFNQTWTLIIGILETAGVLVVLAGLVKPALRTIGVLLLLPFAIGAFTTHMAHQEYHHFYASLAMCILSVVLLVLDKRISLRLA